jgi:hypothetical protein
VNKNTKLSPANRISKPLRFEKTSDDSIIAYDGNDIPSYKICRLDNKIYEVSYTIFSLRLCSTAKKFLNLGIYGSLNDSKKMCILHERCKTKPVFIPGGIKGYVDLNGEIELRDKNFKVAHRNILIKFLYFIKSAARYLFSVFYKNE